MNPDFLAQSGRAAEPDAGRRRGSKGIVSEVGLGCQGGAGGKGGRLARRESRERKESQDEKDGGWENPVEDKTDRGTDYGCDGDEVGDEEDGGLRVGAA